MIIIHLTFSLEVGGTETMLVDIINEQCRHGAVHLILINDCYDADLLGRIDNRVTVHQLGRPVGSRNPVYVFRLNRLLWQLQPTVIHCHNPRAIVPLWLPYRTCLTVHDVNVATTQFRQYNQIFAISNVVRDDIKRRTSLDPELIYNGVPIDAIEPKTADTPAVATFRILQISRLHHTKKGQHVLLNALHELVYRWGMATIQVDFIGSGASEQALMALTESLNLQPYVRFLGLRDRAYIYRELKQYDLLVQPSLYEGFGLTVAEAMAAGVPVLVSNIDGPMEIIDHERYGVAFAVGNAPHCAQRIREIMAQYTIGPFRDKVSQAQHRARTVFDVRRTARQYLASYAR